jgi:hypothetical protein
MEFGNMDFPNFAKWTWENFAKWTWEIGKVNLAKYLTKWYSKNIYEKLNSTSITSNWWA